MVVYGRRQWNEGGDGEEVTAECADKSLQMSERDHKRQSLIPPLASDGLFATEFPVCKMG